MMFTFALKIKNDHIISGAENISSKEVERYIHGSPKLLETAGIGIPYPRWQQVPKALFGSKKEGPSDQKRSNSSLCLK
jgi:acyl-CoA synthetase (AMP-forming)/AMP-acid ligase II